MNLNAMLLEKYLNKEQFDKKIEELVNKLYEISSKKISLYEEEKKDEDEEENENEEENADDFSFEYDDLISEILSEEIDKIQKDIFGLDVKDKDKSLSDAGYEKDIYEFLNEKNPFKLIAILGKIINKDFQQVFLNTIEKDSELLVKIFNYGFKEKEIQYTDTYVLVYLLTLKKLFEKEVKGKTFLNSAKALNDFIEKYPIYLKRTQNVLKNIGSFRTIIKELSEIKELHSVLNKKIELEELSGINLSKIKIDLNEFSKSALKDEKYSEAELENLENLLLNYINGLFAEINSYVEEFKNFAANEYATFGIAKNEDKKINFLWFYYTLNDILSKSSSESIKIFHRFFLPFRDNLLVAIDKKLKEFVRYKTAHLINAVRTEALQRFVTEFSLIEFQESIKDVIKNLKSKIDIKNPDKIFDEVIMAFKRENKYYSFKKLVYIIIRNGLVNILRKELYHGLHVDSKKHLYDLINSTEEIPDKLKFFTIKKSSTKLNEIDNAIKQYRIPIIKTERNELLDKIVEIADNLKVRIPDEEKFIINFIRRIGDSSDNEKIIKHLKHIYLGYRIATMSTKEENKLKDDLNKWLNQIDKNIIEFSNKLKNKNTVITIDLFINNVDNICYYFNLDNSSASRTILHSIFSDIFDIYDRKYALLLNEISPLTKEIWKKNDIIKSIHKASLVDEDILPETLDKIYKLNEEGDFNFDKLQKLNLPSFEEKLVRLAKLNELQKQELSKTVKTPMSINLTKRDEEILMYTKLRNILGGPMNTVELTKGGGISEGKSDIKFNLELLKNQGLIFVKKFFADIGEVYQIIDKEKIDRKSSYFYNKIVKNKLFADLINQLMRNKIALNEVKITDEQVNEFLKIIDETPYKNLKGDKRIFDRIVKAAIENGKKSGDQRSFKEKVKSFIIEFFLNPYYKEQPLRNFLLFKDQDYRKGVISELLEIVSKISKSYERMQKEEAAEASLSRFRAYFSNDIIANKLNSHLKYLRQIEDLSLTIVNLCNVYNKKLKYEIDKIKNPESKDADILREHLATIVNETETLHNRIERLLKEFVNDSTISIYSTFIFSIFDGDVLNDEDLSVYFEKIKKIFETLIEKTNEETDKFREKIKNINVTIKENLDLMKKGNFTDLKDIDLEKISYKADISFLSEFRNNIVDIIEKIETIILEKNKSFNYNDNFNVYTSNIKKLLSYIGDKINKQTYKTTPIDKDLEYFYEYIMELMNFIEQRNVPLSPTYLREEVNKKPLNIIDKALQSKNNVLLLKRINNYVYKDDLDKLVKLGEQILTRYNIISPKDIRSRELLYNALRHYIRIILPFFEDNIKKEDQKLYELYEIKVFDNYVIEQLTKDYINYSNIKKDFSDKKQKIKFIFNRFKELLRNTNSFKKVVLKEESEENTNEMIFNLFLEELQSKLKTNIKNDFINILNNNKKIRNAIKSLILENKTESLNNLIYQTIVSSRNNLMVAEILFVVLIILCNIKNFSVLNYSRIQSQSKKLSDLLQELKESIQPRESFKINKEFIFKELKDNVIPNFIVAISSNSYWVSKALRFIERETLDANIFSEFYVYEENIKNFLESSKYGLITMCAKIYHPEETLHMFLKKMNNFVTQERIEKIGVPYFKSKIGGDDTDISMEDYIDNYLYKKGYYGEI